VVAVKLFGPVQIKVGAIVFSRIKSIAPALAPQVVFVAIKESTGESVLVIVIVSLTEQSEASKTSTV
jgi:hypothetical protein